MAPGVAKPVSSMFGRDLITTKNARKSTGPVLKSKKLDATIYQDGSDRFWNRFWNRFENIRSDNISPVGKYTAGN